MVKITAAQLQSDFDHYRDIAQRQPVSVMENGEESLVMMSADEYRRLKFFDDRQALYPWELPDDVIAELDKGYQGEPTPHLDHLMK
jgi:PHD/YefM family antitoxin component YafN of YafNO toxin-antitoxin module